METTKTNAPVTTTDIRFLLVLVICVPILLAGAGWLIWRGMGHVGPDAARLWAILATLALPVAAWGFYRLGHTEARGRLRGIDDGLERVAKAAAQVQEAGTRAVDLRGQAASTMRRALRESDPGIVVELPPLDDSFRMRQALPAGEVIDLE